MITSIHITTPLNYRRTISGRSDFSVIDGFPEVYHAEEITTQRFSAPARRITGQGNNTTYSVMSS
ncbi:hypothetical protein CAA36_23580 [Escherichia coli]|nr:hypothetical protein [Escherichia coli]MDD9845267.1 hypothetical protein [Escherichia coli]OPP28757.1 hypothetical protein BSV06_20060 [Salmonella enterica subsp. enterica serovar Enteritidis]OXK55991.1 hypothetical protein CDL35_25785 [Escherichia coli]